jgi:hypothetical protein
MKKLEKLKWINVRTLLLLLLFLGSYSVNAQVDKMKESIEDENYKRVLKIFDASMEDSKSRKNPELYYLKAKALYELMRDPYYLKKNPESYKHAMKMLKKAAGYDPDQEVYFEYESVVDNYVEINNSLAKDYYEINKYGKANRTYKESYDLNGSLEAFYMRGKCTMLMLDSADAEHMYNLLLTKYEDEFEDSKSNEGMMIDPYLYFVDKYWESSRYDSANYYLEAARKIFGATERLDYFQMEVAKAQIKSLPPSTLMMEVIQRNLIYFPRDTFLIHKENALYLYMIRTAINANRDIRADTLIDRMARTKVARANSDLAKDFKITDAFYETKYENVLWKITIYYFKYDHKHAGAFLADMYIRATANDTTKEAILDRWLVIIDYAAKKKSLLLGAELLRITKADYPDESALVDIENSLVVNFKGKDLSTADLGALRLMMINTEQQDEEYSKISSDYVNQLVKNKDYRDAKEIISYEMLREPESKVWPRKLIYLAKEDFYNNYYLSRVKEETVAGMKVNGFTWNGKTYECDPGTIEDDIQQKVENRINYFRRNAGLNEIYLDNQLNQWCQKAALMMEANRRLHHEPNTKWSCYSDEGATAARYSLLTKGANTSLAVTSFFADNQNPSVGNRRWLLYPNGEAFGHGSTDNYTAIWALDDSGKVDTSQYQNKFVAWPPEGVIPKMMAFRYWSFSLSQDLKGAEVTLMENGQNVAIKQQELVLGYGMNTLVWEPQTSFKEMNADRKIHVIIKLTNGRIYEYDVTVLDFEAKGY